MPKQDEACELSRINKWVIEAAVIAPVIKAVAERYW